MSVAWTTVAIIALLLPGVFFLIGLATSERYSREIVRASAVSEIAVALLVAILVHLLAQGVLRLIGFDAESFFRPLIDLDTMAPDAAVHAAFERVWRVLLYVAATAVLSFILGFFTSRLVKAGPLRWLAVHKWPHDIPEGGSVTAYTLTTTADNDRALMYKGFLHEYYLNPDGSPGKSSPITGSSGAITRTSRKHRFEVLRASMTVTKPGRITSVSSKRGSTGGSQVLPHQSDVGSVTF